MKQGRWGRLGIASITATSIALTLAPAACTTSPPSRTRHSFRIPPSPSDAEGYRLLLPGAATPVTFDGQPGVSLHVPIGTNLPDGTLVYSEAELIPRIWGVEVATDIVQHGSVLILVGSNLCQRTSGFSLKVVVRPFYEQLASHGGRSGNIPAPRQPQDVLDVLGDRFQGLIGEQVTTVRSHREQINQIAVTRTFVMPPLPSTFAPACP